MEVEVNRRLAAAHVSWMHGLQKEAVYGGMVCWYPPHELQEDIARLACLGEVGYRGEEEIATDHIHMTIAFLPELMPEDVTRVAEILRGIGPLPLEGELSGTATFVSAPTEDCAVLLVDCPGLDALRKNVVTALEEAGVQVSHRHGFTPHITIRYGPPGTAYVPQLLRPVPITVDGLSVATANGTRLQVMPAAPDDHDVVADCVECGDGLCVKCAGDAFVKVSEEYRFTMSPLYAPDRTDAHGEWTTAENLFDGMIGYALDTDRRIRLQHGEKTVGDLVGVLPWPYEHEVKLELPGKKARVVKLPPGTWYIGIRWDEDAWEAVKAGKINGTSMGGRAVRRKTEETPPTP